MVAVLYWRINFWPLISQIWWKGFWWCIKSNISSLSDRGCLNSACFNDTTENLSFLSWCPCLPCQDAIVSFSLCCSVMHILQKSSSACHTKGHAHYVDNWCGLSREPECDDGAVAHRTWLSFSVAGTSPTPGCYDTKRRQHSCGTLWHKQLAKLQSVKSI